MTRTTNQTVKCATCGEESGGAGTSMYGSVHKYGPTTHTFTSAPQPATETHECWTCWECSDPHLTSYFSHSCYERRRGTPVDMKIEAVKPRHAGHDIRIRPVRREVMS